MRWSLHPKIQPMELISSWIKRISQEYDHDLNAILGTKIRLSSINTIDQGDRDDILERLANRTGTDIELIKQHSLRYFEDHFPNFVDRRGVRRTGLESCNRFNDKFLVSLRGRPKDNGMRYCPICLQDDEVPYFRIYWRLGFHTACHIHKILLNNKCGECGNLVYFFNSTTDITECRSCNTEWRQSDTIEVDVDVVNNLKDIFFKQSQIYKIYASEFLGYFWNAFSLLLSRDNDYLMRLCEKYELWDDTISHPLYLRHQGLILVWKLFDDNVITFDRPLPCVECDETFSRNAGLTKHLTYHEEPQLECSICSEKYHMNFEYNRHQTVHQNSTCVCVFCSAPFHRKQRMNEHVHKVHSVELQKEIREKIDHLSNNDEHVTYLTVAKMIGISRSLFSRHDEYSEIFKDYNDLRYYYLKYSTLPVEERKVKQKKLVQTAINRLLQENKNITQISVAEEMGMNRHMFHKYPEFSELVDEYRTIGEIDVEKLYKQVEGAIEDLEKEDEKITFTVVAEEIDVCYQTLNKDESVRQLIVDSRPGYLPNEELELSEVKKVVQRIKNNEDKITKTAIMEELNIHWDKLHSSQEITDYIENEILRQREEKLQDRIEKIRKILEKLMEENVKISFREVSRHLKLDVHKILDEPRFEKIINKWIKRQEKQKLKLVKLACDKLLEEDKRITFANVRKITGFGRKYTENGKARQIIEKIKLSSVN